MTLSVSEAVFLIGDDWVSSEVWYLRETGRRGVGWSWDNGDHLELGGRDWDT